MKLVQRPDDDNDDGLGIDMGDADDQELEAIAYRVTQVLWDRCEALANRLAHEGINHPVIFLCDPADHMGLAIAEKISSSLLIKEALSWTEPGKRPGIIVGVDMNLLEDKEP